MKFLLLDVIGAVLAIAIGLTVFYFGGVYGLPYLALVIVFLIASVAATRYAGDMKRGAGLYEYERGWENVLANGLVPAFCALFGPGPHWAGAYIGAVAAITADKFASEIGVLGGEPRSLAGFGKAKRGESGAVSLLGLLASFDGAALIGAACFFLFPGVFDFWGVLAVAAVGFSGSFVDSLLGVFEERGIGNKMTTNIVCSVAGAVLGYYLIFAG
ncbi:MAG: DUF92 domain-containing protein [Candidatus Micrarchaeota archaeon]|nr:DUF92 domain-containing protein [Candidatus Micrarchaeota archaeon]